MAALQHLEMEWRPEASHEGLREAGIGQRKGCRDRVPRAWGARIPLRVRTFLRKALLRPVRSHFALLRLVPYPKNHTLHLVQLPDLGLPGARHWPTAKCKRKIAVGIYSLPGARKKLESKTVPTLTLNVEYQILKANSSPWRLGDGFPSRCSHPWKRGKIKCISSMPF
ncbi:hypothetical protein SAMN05216308_101692 [Nitrosospira sp. Nsp13]|nr:hypothetical protein SAMN05216308_101692 [Nitrosospira sp. Nsp13]